MSTYVHEPQSGPARATQFYPGHYHEVGDTSQRQHHRRQNDDGKLVAAPRREVATTSPQKASSRRPPATSRITAAPHDDVARTGGKPIPAAGVSPSAAARSSPTGDGAGAETRRHPLLWRAFDSDPRFVVRRGDETHHRGGKDEDDAAAPESSSRGPQNMTLAWKHPLLARKKQADATEFTDHRRVAGGPEPLIPIPERCHSPQTGTIVRHHYGEGVNPFLPVKAGPRFLYRTQEDASRRQRARPPDRSGDMPPPPGGDGSSRGRHGKESDRDALSASMSTATFGDMEKSHVIHHRMAAGPAGSDDDLVVSPSLRRRLTPEGMETSASHRGGSQSRRLLRDGAPRDDSPDGGAKSVTFGRNVDTEANRSPGGRDRRRDDDDDDSSGGCHPPPLKLLRLADVALRKMIDRCHTETARNNSGDATLAHAPSKMQSLATSKRRKTLLARHKSILKAPQLTSKLDALLKKVLSLGEEPTAEETLAANPSAPTFGGSASPLRKGGGGHHADTAAAAAVAPGGLRVPPTGVRMPLEVYFKHGISVEQLLSWLKEFEALELDHVFDGVLSSGAPTVFAGVLVTPDVLRRAMVLPSLEVDFLMLLKATKGCPVGEPGGGGSNPYGLSSLVPADFSSRGAASGIGSSVVAAAAPSNNYSAAANALSQHLTLLFSDMGIYLAHLRATAVSYRDRYPLAMVKDIERSWAQLLENARPTRNVRAVGAGGLPGTVTTTGAHPPQPHVAPSSHPLPSHGQTSDVAPSSPPPAVQLSPALFMPDDPTFVALGPPGIVVDDFAAWHAQLAQGLTKEQAADTFRKVAVHGVQLLTDVEYQQVCEAAAAASQMSPPTLALNAASAVGGASHASIRSGKGKSSHGNLLHPSANRAGPPLAAQSAAAGVSLPPIRRKSGMPTTAAVNITSDAQAAAPVRHGSIANREALEGGHLSPTGASLQHQPSSTQPPPPHPPPHGGRHHHGPPDRIDAGGGVASSVTIVLEGADYVADEPETAAPSTTTWSLNDNNSNNNNGGHPGGGRGGDHHRDHHSKGGAAGTEKLSPPHHSLMSSLHSAAPTAPAPSGSGLLVRHGSLRSHPRREQPHHHHGAGGANKASQAGAARSGASASSVVSLSALPPTAAATAGGGSAPPPRWRRVLVMTVEGYAKCWETSAPQ